MSFPSSTPPPPSSPPPTPQTRTHHHHHPQPHSPGSCRVWGSAGSPLLGWRCRGLPDPNAVPPPTHTHRVQGFVGDVFFPLPLSQGLQKVLQVYGPMSCARCPVPPTARPAHSVPSLRQFSSSLLPPSYLSPPPTPGVPTFSFIPTC